MRSPTNSWAQRAIRNSYGRSRLSSSNTAPSVAPRSLRADLAHRARGAGRRDRLSVVRESAEPARHRAVDRHLRRLLLGRGATADRLRAFRESVAAVSVGRRRRLSAPAAALSAAAIEAARAGRL